MTYGFAMVAPAAPNCPLPLDRPFTVREIVRVGIMRRA